MSHSDSDRMSDRNINEEHLLILTFISHAQPSKDNVQFHTPLISAMYICSASSLYFVSCFRDSRINWLVDVTTQLSDEILLLAD